MAVNDVQRSRHFLSRLRLIAQSLATPGEFDSLGLVERMTCLQAQDLRSGRSAVALRGGCAVADVDAAINDGSIVRSWPMRGTLHLLPAADLRWMLSLNADSTLRSARRRHEELQITERDVESGIAALTEHLSGGRGLDRAGVFAIWEAHGIRTGEQRGIHLLHLLCVRAQLVLGPIVDRKQQFVRYDDWITESRPVDRLANIADWALRYFRSHGPATLADFKWWTGLLQRDIAPVWDDVRAQLVELEVNGSSYFLAAETLERWERSSATTLRPLLLPAFDEMILGYADRTPTIHRPHLDLVSPGGNGVFKPVLLDGGRGVAAWRRGPTKTPQNIEVSPFDGALSARADRAITGLSRRFPFAA